MRNGVWLNLKKKQKKHSFALSKDSGSALILTCRTEVGKCLLDVIGVKIFWSGIKVSAGKEFTGDKLSIRSNANISQHCCLLGGEKYWEDSRLSIDFVLAI
jgi:hypothetical protein